MIPHVVDASVVIKWFVDEIHAEAARRLQEDQFGLSAPDLLWPECGNILWNKVRRGELTPEEARLIWGGRTPRHQVPAAPVGSKNPNAFLPQGLQTRHRRFITLISL